MKNPFRGIKRNYRLHKASNSIFDSIDQEHKMGKNFLKSWTFWTNILAGILVIAETIPLDPDTQALIIAAVNVALRFKTKEKINVMSDKSNEPELY